MPTTTRPAASESLQWLRHRPRHDPMLAERIEHWEQLLSTPCRNDITSWHDLTIEDWRALDLVGDPLAENFILAKAEEGLKDLDDLAALDIMREQGHTAALNLWESINYVPDFIDFDEMKPALNALMRNPVGLVTSLFSALVFTYRDPNVAGVLDFSGRLGYGGDISRRYWETLRGVVDGSKVEDIKPGGSSWARWVRIRLMHSRVRIGISRSGTWDYGLGTPISAASISGGVYTFANYPVQAARGLGGYFSQREFDAMTRQWQWVTLLQGAPPELVPADISDQHRLSRQLFRERYQRPATDAALRLTDYYYESIGALLSGVKLPRWLTNAIASRSLTHGMSDIPSIASRIAVDLEIPNPPISARLLSALAFANSIFANACRWQPLGKRVAEAITRLTETLIWKGLEGQEATHTTSLG
ncbi:hypothetical protein MSTE_02520 [Mycobacteroides stephanolepidis]|uniref:ER-bound oxygenase mpaB/mpaB'/Rubber oxygenase catalytic domain-containing protein n=1 Tax=[Mycobacterium] stephanolepidis TaxID=1520670 RepID=A0A1Z4EXY0_9MYCO|nr:oxygenase MpaB family protein [[Mycobacterium] stephanolepidis]BAX97830.1 hypothetical protein MSTE_02520 [[Mycobacterium] stephanolepidis]